MCQLYEYRCLISSTQPLLEINSSLSDDDDIRRDICDSYIPNIDDSSKELFQCNAYELNTMESVSRKTRPVAQSIVDADVSQPADIENMQERIICESFYQQNSDDLNLYLPNKIVQPISSTHLPSSLQFVHEVHPYQKTHFDAKDSDEHMDRTRSPYIMLIQGTKNDADKGKRILPRLSVSSDYENLIKVSFVFLSHPFLIADLNYELLDLKLNYY